MAVVPAFTSIIGTDQAGMTAYYRAPGCNSVKIADVLPILSKINYYEEEYIIGEILIWDTGVQSIEPNNCAMVRVIVYNDGWICAWFDKTTTNQLAIGGGQYYATASIGGLGSSLEYEDHWNGAQLKITDTADPDVPIGTVFTIKNTNHANGYITISYTDKEPYPGFHSGYTYDCEIYQSNGNLVWWGVDSSTSGVPASNSNRLYRAIIELWTVIRTSSNSTNWSPTGASLVYMYDLQLDTYTNKTTVFNDTAPNDCQVLPSDEVINDAFYIGHSSKFNGITIIMGTPGEGSAITWEYWDGSAWTALSCVDGSTGFTAGGELTFNPPDSWSKVLVNGIEYFWIRGRVTSASYTVTPILTQGQLYSQSNIGYLETELGVYNFEFTSANYVLIYGVQITGGAIDNWFYSTVLPNKIIYDHVLNYGCDPTNHPTYVTKLYINGIILWDTQYYATNGYINFDLCNKEYAPGIQNTFKNYSNIHNSTTPACGAVLIVN